MSDAAGEHHDPPHTDVPGTNNDTGGKLGNCKIAGGVGGYNLLLLSLIFRSKIRWYCGIKLHIT